MKNLALFIPEVRDLLSGGKLKELKDLLGELHPVEIARGFEELDDSEQIQIFRVLDDEAAIDLFEELDFEFQSRLLASMSKERAIYVLDGISPDERADFFAELSPQTTRRLFSLMKKEEVDDVIRLLRYKEDSAGGIMTTDFVALPGMMDVDEAINYLRGEFEAESISYIYVIEGEGYLKGVISIRGLITSRPGATLEEIMGTDPICVPVDMDQEEVARMVADYNLLAIPVVEDENRLVGIVTVDDCIDILNEEASEDIYKMAGAGYKEEMIKDPALRVVHLRLPWLLTCLFGGMISIWILKFFDVALKEVIALAFFIPVIIAMGGNVGIQSSTTIIRGIATGEVDVDRVRKIVLREISIGLLMGLICGIILGMATPLLRIGNYALGLVVGASIFITLTIATLVGAFSPIILKKRGVDPAVAAGPFVTTAVDVGGLTIYFTLATIFLRYLT